MTSTGSHPGVGQARRFLPEADFRRPVLEVGPAARDRFRNLLAELYGTDDLDALVDEVVRILREHWAYRRAEDPPQSGPRFTESDAILITYGDLILADDASPLRTLARVARDHFQGLVTILHILPFFPWSSDRGFSVRSYWLVDPALGDWDDIAALNDHFRLMFDAVFNHASRGSRWFQEFRKDHPHFRGFFIDFDAPDAIPPEHLAEILRPRTNPLLSPVDTIRGRRWVWTTFSEDQVDLNFRNPRVLFEILRLLLFYVRRGGSLIRLDAVTYLWKELGTSCAHLPQTHAAIQLLRAALDEVAPHVALVTETNVPHRDNVSYFGSGTNEAQMVYNFALPPLVLHTFHTADARVLSDWARALEPPSSSTHFLNFLSSHDGVGLMGARGILSDGEIGELCDRTLAHGGLVSMRTDPERGESPYELNITWYNAVNAPDSPEPVGLQVDRFIASRAIALILKGVPGIYLPALIGSRNDLDAVARTRVKRDINRTGIDEPALRRLLADPESTTARIADRFFQLLRVRSSEPAFHPESAQEVLEVGASVFALVRRPASGPPVLCLVGVTDAPVRVGVDVRAHSLEGPFRDLVSGALLEAAGPTLDLTLDPYAVRLLRCG